MQSTVLVLRMAQRKWKESKQQPSMLPGPAVPGCCLVSFHIMWAILSTSTVFLVTLIGKAVSEQMKHPGPYMYRADGEDGPPEMERS